MKKLTINYKGLLEELYTQRKMVLIGMGTVFASAILTRSFFPREVSNIEIYESNEGGYIDHIVDNNWKILLTNNLTKHPPVDASYRVCLYSTEIPTENIASQFSERVRPLLEFCLKN